MLNLVKRPSVAGVGFLLVAFLSLSCQQQETPPEEASPNEISTVTVSPITGKATDGALQHVIGGQSDWAPLFQSLPDLIRVDGTIVVGLVTGVFLPFDPRPGLLGQPTPEPLPSDHPKYFTPSPEELSRPPGRGFSVYSVELLAVLAPPSLQTGDTIAVMQSGGVFEGIAYEDHGDPVIEVGATYLFFLQPQLGLREISIAEPWGTTYSGGPFGRFLVDPDGRLNVVDDIWNCPICTVSQALAGKTVVEATVTIKNTPPGFALPTPGPDSPLSSTP